LSKTVELKIEGMSCIHCEKRVKKALETIEGVENATVDHKKGIAIVTLTHEVSHEKLATTVADAGYQVKN
jgi:Cu2+-exporting ATPase